MEEVLQQGIAKAKNGDYTAAIELFTKAIALNDKSAQAYYHRGLAYYDLGNIASAIADYDRSLNLDSRQVNVYFSRAMAFLAMDNLQSSIIDLQVVLSLDPNCDKAYKLQANICVRLKEYDEAIDYLKQAGKIYLERQDKESCRFCLARIRQIEQQKIEVQGGVTNQAFLQQIQQKIDRGNLGEAFSDCNWLLQLDPYDAEAYQYRGKISEKLGEYEQARQDLHQAAKCFRSQGNIAEAQKLTRRCLELQLNNVNHIARKTTPQPKIHRLTRTSQPQNALQRRLYVLVGNWNIAQSLVERLMQLHPAKPETWYWEKAIYDLERDRL
ncbi:tetratricopeptide repeat protein [Pleurocapsales cyanobacterium LEGE 10410]|nr:tetratricopeptide repeat protein [Pleurocapsales cyanobacterium LEGE 10410]